MQLRRSSLRLTSWVWALKLPLKTVKLYVCLIVFVVPRKKPSFPSHLTLSRRSVSTFLLERLNLQGCQIQNNVKRPNLIMSKVHRSKGRTLFIVCVLPSENKQDRMRNKKTHLFTCLTVFYLTRPYNKHIICFGC